MENKEDSFEIQVLTRLAVIENKLDGYKEIKKITYDNEAKTNKNEEDIKELQDKFKWLSRTTAGAIITGFVGIVFIFIKIGLGVN